SPLWPTVTQRGCSMFFGKWTNPKGNGRRLHARVGIDVLEEVGVTAKVADVPATLVNLGYGGCSAVVDLNRLDNLGELAELTVTIQYLDFTQDFEASVISVNVHTGQISVAFYHRTAQSRMFLRPLIEPLTIGQA